MFPLLMPEYRYRRAFHTVFTDVECLSELSLSCVLSLTYISVWPEIGFIGKMLYPGKTHL